MVLLFSEHVHIPSQCLVQESIWKWSSLYSLSTHNDEV